MEEEEEEVKQIDRQTRICNSNEEYPTHYIQIFALIVNQTRNDFCHYIEYLKLILTIFF